MTYALHIERHGRASTRAVVTTVGTGGRCVHNIMEVTELKDLHVLKREVERQYPGICHRHTGSILSPIVKEAHEDLFDAAFQRSEYMD